MRLVVFLMKRTKGDSRLIVLAFMAAAALLSSVMSDTAAVLMFIGFATVSYTHLEVDEFLLGVDVQLAVDVVDVRLRRADGYEELFGDVLRVPAADQHAEHLLLACGELELLDHAVDLALPQGGAALVHGKAMGRA